MMSQTLFRGEHSYISLLTGVYSLSSQVRHYTRGSPPPTKLQISLKTPPPVKGLLACTEPDGSLKKEPNPRTS